MVVPLAFLFTDLDFTFDYSNSFSNIGMSQVRAIYVDNALNTQPLSITHGAAQQTFIVPAAGGAIIPTTSQSGTYTFNLATGNPPPAEFPVNISLYNYEIEPAIWGTEIIVVNNNTIPIGTIVLWYGSAASIPTGFGLCDGTTYTRSDGAGTITAPNTVGLFIGGANAATQGSTGGSLTILQENLPAVNFTCNLVTVTSTTVFISDPGHDHILNDPGHSHTLGGYQSGTSTANLIVDVIEGTAPLSRLHTLAQSTDGAVTGMTINGAFTDISATAASNSTTTGFAESGGSGVPFAPPFLGLCYIMKI